MSCFYFSDDLSQKISLHKARDYDLGFLHKRIIKNLFRCLTDSQQIGLFMAINIYMEFMVLFTSIGLYTILYTTDFFCSHGIFLLFLKVSDILSTISD